MVGTTWRKYWYATNAIIAVSSQSSMRSDELTIACQLKRVVERLSDIGEVRAEGKFGDYVREIHH